MLGSIQQSCEPPDIAEDICMAATRDKNQLRYLAGGAAKQLCTGCLEIGKHNWRVNTNPEYPIGPEASHARNN